MVNENRLVGAVKDAWKHEGYQACIVDGRAIIKTGFFLVQIREEHIPRKLLGLLVEHIGEIPRRLWMCQKGVPARLLTEDVPGDFADPNVVEGLRTCLTLDGYQVWQRRGDLSCELFDGDLTAILDREDGEAFWMGSKDDPSLRIEQDTARLLIAGVRDLRRTMELEELGRSQWWRD